MQVIKYGSGRVKPDSPAGPRQKRLLHCWGVGSTITREPSVSPCSGARLVLELPSFVPDPALLYILGTLVTGPVKEIAEIGKMLTPF